MCTPTTLGARRPKTTGRYSPGFPFGILDGASKHPPGSFATAILHSGCPRHLAAGVRHRDGLQYVLTPRHPELIVSLGRKWTFQ
jgi:hypothetical protein